MRLFEKIQGFRRIRNINQINYTKYVTEGVVGNGKQCRREVDWANGKEELQRPE
jgi:hypothetical protein